MSEASEYLAKLRDDLVLRSQWGVEGHGYHPDADTMIGTVRLRSLQDVCVEVIKRKIPGDFIECGVWRGGACILMRAVLKALAEPNRLVWVADSFQGLPKPEKEQDAGDKHWTHRELAVPRSQVEANFRKYGLLDDRVRFLEGWFKDTLYESPIRQLAILRIDGDMYESTGTCLADLYARLSPGGYAIIDDYGLLAPCRQAVEDFRRTNGITEPLVRIDWTGVYWKKEEART